MPRLFVRSLSLLAILAAPLAAQTPTPTPANAVDPSDQSAVAPALPVRAGQPNPEVIVGAPAAPATPAVEPPLTSPEPAHASVKRRRRPRSPRRRSPRRRRPAARTRRRAWFPRNRRRLARSGLDGHELPERQVPDREDAGGIARGVPPRKGHDPAGRSRPRPPCARRDENRQEKSRRDESLVRRRTRRPHERELTGWSSSRTTTSSRSTSRRASRWRRRRKKASRPRTPSNACSRRAAFPSRIRLRSSCTGWTPGRRASSSSRKRPTPTAR